MILKKSENKIDFMKLYLMLHLRLQKVRKDTARQTCRESSHKNPHHSLTVCFSKRNGMLDNSVAIRQFCRCFKRIFSDLIPQDPLTDPQHLCGAGLNAVGLLQGGHDQPPFKHFHPLLQALTHQTPPPSRPDRLETIQRPLPPWSTRLDATTSDR